MTIMITAMRVNPAPPRFWYAKQYSGGGCKTIRSMQRGCTQYKMYALLKMDIKYCVFLTIHTIM